MNVVGITPEQMISLMKEVKFFCKPACSQFEKDWRQVIRISNEGRFKDWRSLKIPKVVDNKTSRTRLLSLDFRMEQSSAVTSTFSQNVTSNERHLPIHNLSH